MKLFSITIISPAGRDERKIISQSAMAATGIALRILPEHIGEFAIICKPSILKGVQP